jgi:hypothetical protein
LLAKHELLKQSLRRKGIKLSWQEPEVSLLEAALSRGDRRLGKVIHNAWKQGCVFDSWGEHFKYEKWLGAFEKAGLEPGFYAHRQRSMDEMLPWAHINSGVIPAFLKREYQRSLEGRETPDCRTETCSACGLEGRHPDCQQKLRRKSEAS